MFTSFFLLEKRMAFDQWIQRIKPFLFGMYKAIIIAMCISSVFISYYTWSLIMQYVQPGKIFSRTIPITPLEEIVITTWIVCSVTIMIVSFLIDESGIDEENGFSLWNKVAILPGIVWVYTYMYSLIWLAKH